MAGSNTIIISYRSRAINSLLKITPIQGHFSVCGEGGAISELGIRKNVNKINKF